MSSKGLSTESRVVGLALATAAVIGLVGTAAYVWGPLHETYEMACQLYPPLRSLGPAPLGALVTVLLSGLLAGAVTLAREVATSVRLQGRIQAMRTVSHDDVVALARPMGLDGRIATVADDIPYAFSFGLLRPTICLSTGLVSRLDTGELRAVLAHERVHLKRRDPLRFLLARALSRFLWFVPLARELYRRYHLAQELRADRQALATVEREDVAGALLKVLGGGVASGLEVQGVAGFSLTEERIKHLEQPSQPGLPALPWDLAFGKTLVVAGMVLLAFGFLGGTSGAAIFGCQI